MIENSFNINKKYTIKRRGKIYDFMSTVNLNIDILQYCTLRTHKLVLIVQTDLLKLTQNF